jgi:hypothetical protein
MDRVRDRFGRDAVGHAALMLRKGGVPDEFRFGVPKRFVDAMRDGRPVDVVNRGTQHHELVVSRLHPGATASDLATWNDAPAGTAGPAPATDLAGVTMLPPGGHGQLRARLTPGRYVLVCFLPDETGSGHSHLHNGMVFPFTVR